jgi:hypothetical protein
MTHHDRLCIDLAAAAYLDALTRDDVETQARLWSQAAADPSLLAAFQEVHAGLLEENEATDHAAAGAVVAQAAKMHLTSAEVVRPPTGPVTVGDVANELFHHTPDRLPSEAHALNAALRASSEPLPTDLGLWALREWAEGKFGAAPTEYWKAFGEAARKVRMRANSAEYQLAARRAKPPTGDSK